MSWAKPPKRTETEWAAFRYWLQHPVEAVKEWFHVTPDDWQGDFLNAIFTGGTDRVAMKAAHGPGKTTVFAWSGWIFLNGYENSRVVATAPTFHQLHDALFPEYGKWHAAMPEKLKNEWNISGGHIRHKIAHQLWFAVARTSNKPENVQGFHNDHLMFQVDEASGVKEQIFEVIEGAQSEAGEEGRVCKLVIAGNPNFTEGELYHAFHRNKELYQRFTITGDTGLLDQLKITQGTDHPEHGHLYYSRRVRPKYAETMARKYGKQSAVYEVRVRGLFPTFDDECVIPYEWAARNMTDALPELDSHADGCTIVVDVARGGGGENVVGVFRRGVCVDLKAEKPGRASTTPCFNMVKETVLRLTGQGLRISEIIVDEPGVGGGVIDALRRDGLPVTAYNGGVTMKADVDPEDDCRMFANKRARDWWALRRKLELGYPIPNDEVMLAQLTSIKFYYRNEKIVIESKEDLKDRLGKDASPDRGDVIVMGSAPRYVGTGRVSGLKLSDIIVGRSRPKYEGPCSPVPDAQIA